MTCHSRAIIFAPYYSLLTVIFCGLSFDFETFPNFVKHIFNLCFCRNVTFLYNLGKSSEMSQDSSLPSTLPLPSSPEKNDEMVVHPVQAVDEEDSCLPKTGIKRNSLNTLNR